jgi:hypothetical protein
MGGAARLLQLATHLDDAITNLKSGAAELLQGGPPFGIAF